MTSDVLGHARRSKGGQQISRAPAYIATIKGLIKADVAKGEQQLVADRLADLAMDEIA